MTVVKYSVVLLLVLCLYVSGQRLNNVSREYQSEIVFNSVEATQRDSQITQNALGLLKYENVFGHTVIVNPYLLGYYYYSLLFDEQDSQRLAYYYDNAHQLFTQTISQQPTNAKAWANLALLNWLNTQSLDDIEVLVQRAHSYGQYNFRIHVKISQLAQWIAQTNPNTAINSELMKIFVHHLTYGLEDRRSRQAIREIINNASEDKAVICTWLEQTAREKLRCDLTR